MYNIKALEEEWKRYRRKKRRPLYMLLLLSSIVGLLLLWFALNENGGRYYQKILFDNSDPKKQKRVKIEKKVYIDYPLESLEEKKKIKDESVPPIDLDNVEVSEEHPVEREETRKKLHIEVIETKKNPHSFKEVAKRFRLGHDTDDSLFLARSYYQKGDYKKAEYWALQTNKINENIEESWLVFAKAKAKRGRKNEAIRILNEYIKRTRSVEAKVLLEKIKKGKF